MASLRFGCKTMVNDLRNLGEFTSKSHRGRLPQIVKNLIQTSKEMELKQLNNSKLLLLLSKAWLYGFYDGDGSLTPREEGGWISPVIVSGSIELLEDIYQEFALDYAPRVVKKPGEIILLFDHLTVSKGLYILNLGAEFFRNLVKDLYRLTHRYDLGRKRAIPNFEIDLE